MGSGVMKKKQPTPMTAKPRRGKHNNNEGQSTSFWKSRANPLHSLGYLVVPIAKGKKHPNISKWQKREFDLKKNYWGHTGVGIKTGVDCGGGVYVIAVDIDVLDKTVAHKLEQWCIDNIGPAPCRFGKRPKRALLYRMDKPRRKSVTHKYDGKHQIEIIGKGHQLVAYHLHPDTGEPYEWFTEGDNEMLDVAPGNLPPITEQQIDALFKHFGKLAIDADWTCTPTEKHKGTRNNSNAGGEWSCDQLAEHLALLPAVEFSTNDLWYPVMMAAHHTTVGDGIDELIAWSRTDPKYDTDECEQANRKRWRSCDPLTNDGYTVDTLKHELRKRGMPVPGEPTAQEEFGSDRTVSATLDTILEYCVFIEAGSQVADLREQGTERIRTLKEFKDRFANAPEGKTTVAIAWHKHPTRKTARASTFDPREGDCFTRHGMTYVNTFHMKQHLSADGGGGGGGGDINLFHKHMNYLFPEKVEREWFVDFMAYGIQNPGQRSKVAPLHISIKHGTGRGWLIELIEKLVGYWNVNRDSLQSLTGNFNQSIAGCLWLIMDEVHDTGGSSQYAVADALREILTEDRLLVNVKYGGKGTQDIYCNVIMLSNHSDALRLTKEDRRVNVFRGPNKPKRARYYDKLYQWLNNDSNVSLLFNYLADRDLSRFNSTKSINTPGRQRLIDSSQSATEQAFTDFLEDKPFKVSTREMIVDYVRTRQGNEPNNGQLTKLISNNTDQKRLKVDGKTKRVYFFTREQLTNEEVRRLLK